MSKQEFYCPNMQEARIVYLRENCQRNGCGEKVYLCYAEGKTAPDDNGSEFLMCKFYLRCGSCKPEPVGDAVLWHMREAVEQLFQRFEQNIITRAELFIEVMALLRQSSTKLA